MTLALADEDVVQLAGPNDSTPVPPASLRVVSQRLDFPPLQMPEPSGEVGWLTQARELVEEFPGSGTAFARLAHAELLRGDEASAVEAARVALRLTSESRDAATASSAFQVALACGDFELLEEHRNQLEPGGVHPTLFAHAAVMRGDFIGALELLAESGDAVAASMRGWIQLHLRRHEQAIHSFRTALREAGPTPEVLTNLGYGYAAVGSLKKAITVTKQARSLSPASETTAFNLVSYYVYVQRFDDALAELNRLSKETPGSINVALARADVLAMSGEPWAALIELRRTRGKLAPILKPTALAELTANIALLEWRLDRRDVESTRSIIQSELKQLNYEHLGIARMLSTLFHRSSDVSQFQVLHQHLQRSLPSDSLYSFATRLSFLKQDYDAAVVAAEGWMHHEPFSAEAASTLTLLLADHVGDYQRAADIGMTAYRRMPWAWMVANNVSYALAMAGRPNEARRLLPSDDRNAYIVATEALIDSVSGRSEAALRGYRHAAAIAEADGNVGLADRIRIRGYLATRRVELLDGLEPDSVRDMRDDPGFALMLERVIHSNDIWPFPEG